MAAAAAGTRWQAGSADLLEELVTALTVAEGGGHAGAEQHDRLLGFAQRVADSSIACSGGDDADAVFQLLKHRLVQQRRGDDAARLAELYQQLCRNDGLSPRGRFAALALMQQLADRGAGAPASAIGAYKPLALPKVAPLPLRCLSGGGASSSSFGGARGSSGGAADTSFSSATDQATKHGRSPASAAAAALAAGQDPALSGSGGGAPSSLSPSSLSLLLPLSPDTQRSLVRDALRVAQGLTGRHAGFAPGAPSDPASADAGVRLAPHDRLALPEGARTLLHELGELGAMHRRVRAAVEDGRRGGGGAVRQALCAALADELTDFYRLMAVLEAQLAAPLPSPPAAAAGEQQQQLGGSDGDGGAPYLSLRRLQLWLAEPLRRMRLLAALVDATAGRGGGDLAGRVWAASKAGDPLARAYAARLLQQACVPLFAMIRRWVFEGALDDPACEFFVVPQGHSATGGAGAAGAAGSAHYDLWRDGYRLERAKLPPFVGQELALTVLRAGKSLNFLRDACGDGGWLHEWAPGAAEAAAALGYGQLPALERAVVAAARRADARLMAVLRGAGGGEWARHCSAIRRYLLLGQGDFVVALLDGLGAELAKPAADVSEVTLNHLLRQALLASAGGGGSGRGAAAADDDDERGGPAERLRARKAPGGAGETGWDVFALSYAVGPPLSSVFTPAAQAGYGRLSRLLWQLRRTERSLNAAWRVLKVEVERCAHRFAADACAPRLQALLRACLRLRAEMGHLIGHLATYLNLEVLECAWAEFAAAAAAAPDLDALIAAHDRFLAGVLARSLLGPGRAEGVRATLAQLLANCRGLEPLVGRLNEKVQLGLRALDMRAATMAANTAAGRWGATGAAGPAPAVADDDLDAVAAALAALADGHARLLQAFLRGLPPAAAEAGAEVRFLLARLDMSDFYSSGGGGGVAPVAAAQ